MPPEGTGGVDVGAMLSSQKGPAAASDAGAIKGGMGDPVAQGSLSGEAPSFADKKLAAPLEGTVDGTANSLMEAGTFGSVGLNLDKAAHPISFDATPAMQPSAPQFSTLEHGAAGKLPALGG